MDFDLFTRLAEIAEQSSASYFWTALVLCCLAFTLALFLIAKLSPDTFAKRSFYVLLACAALFSIYAGVKPKVQAWPEGVTDNGSCFDTNTWQWVEFRWKLREGYPLNIPLTFYCKPIGDPGDPIALGEESSGTRVKRFYFSSPEIVRNPTNYVYFVTSDYVPAELPSIGLVSSSVSNVTIKVTSATNYYGCAASWQARRKVSPRSNLFGPWQDLGQAFVINESETNRVVDGTFVNGRRDTEIRLKMNISDEGSNGVRP